MSACIALFLIFINIQDESIGLNFFTLFSPVLILLVLLVTCIYAKNVLKSRRSMLYKNGDQKKYSLKSLNIPFKNIKADPALSSNGKGYRKIIVTSMKTDTEKEFERDVWILPQVDEKAEIVLHRDTELSYFNRFANQDKHFHKYATEIYTMIDGSISIEIDGKIEVNNATKVEKKTYDLYEGDSLIVLPFCVHKVIQNDNEDFICQVVAINSKGLIDKFVVN